MRLPIRTTPFTRLSWNSLHGWYDAALTITHRPPSYRRHLQIDAHLAALSVFYIKICADPDLLRATKSLLTAGDFGQPCRGQRAGAPQTALIVAINNRLQHLQRPSDNRSQT